VLSIAKIIMEELSLHNVTLNVSGGPEGRGWNGDVKDMLLDCSKLEGLGWKATHNSAQAVYLTTRGILSKEQKVVETRG
jgi:UDP-glucose 4-epimerase